MPQIWRMRLVNIEYDGGKKVYTDELFRLHGKNTLFNLTNGGGKTLLVQLLLQVVLPNEPFNKRGIVELLAHRRYTGHIAVEWRLDTREDNYLTTGFCFTRGQDEDSRLRYFLYCINYQQANEFDIKHLPLVKERAPLGYTELLSLLKKNTGSREASITVFDQDDRRSAYLEHLKTYNIFAKEWKNIKTINNREGGVAEFFTGATTTKQLLENLIIPAVEEVVFQNEQEAQELARSFWEYYQSLLRIPELEKNLASFQLLRTGGEAVLKEVRGYGQLFDQLRGGQQRLRQLIDRAQEELALVVDRQQETGDVLVRLAQHLKQLAFQQESLEYTRMVRELHQERLALERRQTAYQEAKQRLKAADYRLRRARGENKFLDYQRLAAEIAGWEQERVLRSRGQEEKLAELDLYRATVRRRLQDRELAWQKQRDELKTRIVSEQAEEAALKQQLLAWRTAEKNLVSQRAALETRLQQYQNRWRELWETYQNLTWLEDPAVALAELEQAGEHLRRQLAEVEGEKQRCREEEVVLEQELRELAVTITRLENQLAADQREEQQYQEDWQQLKEMLWRHSINCQDPFAERPRLEAQLLSASLSLQQQQNRQAAELARLEERLSLLKDHAYYVPNQEVLEMQQKLQELNISTRLGSQWLAELNLDPEQKEAYLRHNPFLPYALVLAESDFKRLQRQQTIWADLVLNSLVPLVVRRGELVPPCGESHEGLVPLPGQHAYVVWHRGYRYVLMPSLLAEEQPVLEDQIRRRHENLQGLRLSLDALRRTSDALSGFYQRYGADFVRALKERMAATQGRLADSQRKNQDTEKQLTRLRERLPQLEDEGEKIKERLRQTAASRQDWLKWQVERDKQHQLEAELKQLKKREITLKEEQERLEERLSLLAQRLRQAEGELGRLESELVQIRENLACIPEPGRETVPLPDVPYEQAALILQGLERDVSQVASDISILDEQIRRHRERMAELCGEIERELKLTVEEVSGAERRWTVFELERLQGELEEAEREVDARRQEADEQWKLVTRLEARTEDKAADIQKNHGCLPVQDWEDDLTAAAARIQAAISETERQSREHELLQRQLEETRIELEKILEKLGDAASRLGAPSSAEPMPGEEWSVVKPRLRQTAVELIAQLEGWRSSLQKQREQVLVTFRQYTRVLQEQDNRVLDKFLVHLINDENRLFDVTTMEVIFQKCFTLLDTYEQKVRYELQQCARDKQLLVERCVQQAERIAAEIKTIDRYVKVDYAGQTTNAVLVKLKDWDPATSLADMSSHIEACILKLKEMVGEPQEKLERFIQNQLSSRQLLHVLSNLNQCVVKVLKPDQHPVSPRYDNWENVEKWSGGEKYAGFTAMFMAILSYTRSKLSSLRNPAKVLVADNPFGAASSPHVLNLIFQIAANNNIQMICLTALTEEAIFSFFPVVYSLRLRQFLGKDYVQSVVEKGFYQIDPLEKELVKKRQLALFGNEEDEVII